MPIEWGSKWPTIDRVDEHVDLAKEVEELRELLDSFKKEKDDREKMREKIRAMTKTVVDSFCKDPAFENALTDFVAHGEHRTINMLRFLIDCDAGELIWHSMHDIVPGGYGDYIHKGKEWED